MRKRKREKKRKKERKKKRKKQRKEIKKERKRKRERRGAEISEKFPLNPLEKEMYMVPEIEKEIENPTRLSPTFLQKIELGLLNCYDCKRLLKEDSAYVIAYKDKDKFVFKIACSKHINIDRPIYTGLIKNFLKRLKSGQLEEMVSNAKS